MAKAITHGTRRFAGIGYAYVATYPTEAKAKAVQKAWQRSGHLARITKSKAGYIVWQRGK